LNIFLELGNAEAIVSTVKAGFGISFVSKLAAACACAQKQIVGVPVNDLQLRRQVYMMRRSLNTPDRAQEVFWGFIHDPSNADILHLTKE